MALGPGKYDHLATHVREQAKARGVILLVVDGEHGMGFSVQTDLEVLVELPGILRRLADKIESDIGG
jgi:hypothetical protein